MRAGTETRLALAVLVGLERTQAHAIDGHLERGESPRVFRRLG
jgi:hypothetical protein